MLQKPEKMDLRLVWTFERIVANFNHSLPGLKKGTYSNFAVSTSAKIVVRHETSQNHVYLGKFQKRTIFRNQFSGFRKPGQSFGKTVHTPSTLGFAYLPIYRVLFSTDWRPRNPVREHWLTRFDFRSDFQKARWEWHLWLLLYRNDFPMYRNIKMD